jgi:hypothetical protein
MPEGPRVILAMAMAIVVTTAGNWNAWASDAPADGDSRPFVRRAPLTERSTITSYSHVPNPPLPTSLTGPWMDVNSMVR